VEIGPTQLAFDEWAAAGLDLPDLTAMRRYRWERLTRHIVDRGYAGLLMFDPLNIRYATDTTNMQLWNTHNPFRACLLCADGHMVLWEYKQRPVPGRSQPAGGRGPLGRVDVLFLQSATGATEAARAFAGQVADILRAHAGQPAAGDRQDHAAGRPRAGGRGVRDPRGRGGHGKGALGQGPRRDPRDALRLGCLREIDGRWRRPPQGRA
jgi:hypothetical protein